MFGTLLFLGVALALVIALLTIILAREMVRPPRHTAGYAVAKGLPCDPGDLGFEYDEWWLDRPDGARVPVWEINARSDANRTSQTGLTAVFIHGWGHSRIDMLPQATLWSTLCDHMVFYDLRGHGESEHCLSRLGDGEDDDLLALLDQLGSGPCILIGFSMGAVIALHAAASDHPIANQLRGVIVYGPYLDFHRSLQGRLKRHHLPTRPITDLALLNHRLRGITPRSITADVLHRIRCPVLVIHGGVDVVAPIAHGRTVAETVRDGELLVIDETDHALHDLINHHAHDETVSRFVTHQVHPAREAQASQSSRD